MPTNEPPSSDPRDFAPAPEWIPPAVREALERTYYAEIERRASLEQFVRDPEFLQDPASHLAFYTDHGVVHVRDVARNLLDVLDVVHGVLIPARESERLDCMRAYGVALAYVHDIGMVDFTRFGREMHPEFATQEVFAPRFDAWVDALWDADCGGLSRRLRALVDEGAVEGDPRRVLREMLSMANAHSKTKVPVSVLNDPPTLRRLMVATLGTSLESLHALQQEAGARTWIGAARLDGGDSEVEPLFAGPVRPSQRSDAWHPCFPRDAYRWIVSEHPGARALLEDVVDTLRAFRCADALRQRGTHLRTSGGYQVMVSRVTASAIYALTRANGDTFLVEADTTLSGEANVASSELTRDGDVWISFHRGAFPDEATTRRAVVRAALVVNDVQADIVESFQRPSRAPLPPPLKPAGQMLIFLEGVEDNLEFAQMVREEVEEINPRLRGRVVAAPMLRNIADEERRHYLNAVPVQWPRERRVELLRRMAARGHRTEGMDPAEAFRHVRMLSLRRGQVLMEANWPSGFVYVPLGPGLMGRPLGGYHTFAAHELVPLGNTGVVRGAVRNSTVTAEQDVEVLVIPPEVYMRHWHRTYTLQEFARMHAPE